MSIIDSKYIDVLNFNSFSVTIKTKDLNKAIDGTTDENPIVLQLTPEEVKYIHNSSNAFKDGLLFFDKDFEKEIYEELLRLPNWENILKNSEISDIILNPTIEGLTKIIENESSIVLDRVRAIYTNLKNIGIHDISYRVLEILDERYKEIQNKIYKTNIDLTNKIVEKIDVAEVNLLKKQNEDMQKQMEEMQAIMASLVKKENENKTDEVNKLDEEKIETPKQAGRPRNR